MRGKQRHSSQRRHRSDRRLAPDGPERCSGLPVTRRSANDIAALMDDALDLVHATDEMHLTRAGQTQHFVYAVLQRRSHVGQ